jgi:hypothetical protein
VSLLTELDDFYTEHRRCGELEAGVDAPVVWIGCECGVAVARRADEDRAVLADWFTRAASEAGDDTGTRRS